MGRYEVMLFDGYFCDVIITGLPAVPRLGTDLFGTGMGVFAGGSFNTVRALHRLRVEVGWVCDFGNDIFSQFVLTEVHREAVDTSLFRIHDYPLRSFSLAFSIDGERGFVSYMDPIENYDRAHYLLQQEPACVILGHLQFGGQFDAIVQAARQVGAIVCMDCQSAQADLETPGVIEALKSIDVFLPNAGEAMELTGAGSPEEAAEILSALTPLTVLKLGPAGALARTREEEIHSPAIAVEVVDTTGAGDCFNAGFIYGCLRGEPLETCLRIGNFCGGMSTTAYGSTAAPTEMLIKDYLSHS